MNRRDFLKAVAVLPFAKHLLPEVEPLGQTLVEPAWGDVPALSFEEQAFLLDLAEKCDFKIEVTYADKILEYEPIAYGLRSTSPGIYVNDTRLPHLDYDLAVDVGEDIPMYAPSPNEVGEFKLVNLITNDPGWTLNMKIREDIFQERRLAFTTLPGVVSVWAGGEEVFRGENYSNRFRWDNDGTVDVRIIGHNHKEGKDGFQSVDDRWSGAEYSDFWDGRGAKEFRAGGE